MNRSQAYIIASELYLCEPLPEDFDELDEQDVMDFIRDNRWEPFEEWEPHGIWELIDDLARKMLKIHKLATSELKPKPKPEKKCCEFCDSNDIFRSGLCYICWEDQYSDYALW